MRRATALLAAAVLMAGCGATHAPRTPTIPADLAAGLRPIGAGVRFHPPVTGRPVLCRPDTGGRERAHIELFAENKVVLIAADVGRLEGCEGDVVTRDPTGTVYFEPGASLFDLFTSWGEPLSRHQLASFRGTVREYINGHRIPFVGGALTNDAEIVLEVGPYVPPHSHYTYPSGS